MALTKIEFGSLADPEIINDNFEYLEEQIIETSSKIYDNNASLESLITSQVLTLTNDLNSTTKTLQESIDKLGETDKTHEESMADIYNKMSPDYTKGVDVEYPVADSKWTAPSYGVYITSVRGRTNSQLYINDILTAFMFNTAYCQFIIPVSKGDVLHWSQTAITVSSSMFYPYKGCK